MKVNSFEEVGTIGSLTNPADFTHNKAFLDDVWNKGLKTHPKTGSLRFLNSF